MALEKERKFILNDKEGMVYAPAVVIQQGYLFLDNQKEVRIRLYNGFEFKKAELCIKTYITKSTRKEFEYEIPFEDAVELYSKCEFKLEKSRQSLEYHDIHVDIDYYPSGLKVVELEFSDEILQIPSFCGEEVTGKYEYTNIYLAKSNKEFFNRGIVIHKSNMDKENQEVSYEEIEKLTVEVYEFIKNKGFDIVDEYEFLTRLEKVLFEGIDKHYD